MTLGTCGNKKNIFNTPYMTINLIKVLDRYLQTSQTTLRVIFARIVNG